MSTRSPETTTKVLHIRSAPADDTPADRMDKMLAETVPALEVCGDVYRGLARLVRRGSEAPQAVVVCVDDLGPPEMEFFPIVSRNLRGTDVYVYGDRRFASRVSKAVELGAAGWATEEVIRQLAVRSDRPLADATDPAAAGPQAMGYPEGSPPVSSVAETAPEREPPTSVVIGEAEQTETVEPTGTAPAADQSPAWRTDEPENADEGRASTAAPVGRVPWLRYGDAPVRKGPPRGEPKDQQTAKGAPKPSSSLHEPLLTEEELHALLGDDIAAIAPEDHNASDPTEVENGEG